MIKVDDIKEYCDIKNYSRASQIVNLGNDCIAVLIDYYIDIICVIESNIKCIQKLALDKSEYTPINFEEDCALMKHILLISLKNGKFALPTKSGIQMYDQKWD